MVWFVGLFGLLVIEFILDLNLLEIIDVVCEYVVFSFLFKCFLVEVLCDFVLWIYIDFIYCLGFMMIFIGVNEVLLVCEGVC